jgi:hypothetical protein
MYQGRGASENGGFDALAERQCVGSPAANVRTVPSENQVCRILYWIRYMFAASSGAGG